MPLIKGFSAASFEKNVRKLRREGRPTREAIAAAYETARRALSRAGRRETKALREAWKKAIAKGLHGTGTKAVHKKEKALKAKRARKKSIERRSYARKVKKPATRKATRSATKRVHRPVSTSAIQRANEAFFASTPRPKPTGHVWAWFKKTGGYGYIRGGTESEAMRSAGSTLLPGSMVRLTAEQWQTTEERWDRLMHT